MSLSRYLGATTLVLTALLTGCAGTEPIEDLDGPEVAPLHGGSSGGTNGADSDELEALTTPLLSATDSQLVFPGTMQVHPAIAGDLLVDPAGARILDYAVQCAISASPADTVYWGIKEFHGKGHLSSTQGWLSGPLDPLATNDLFACMLVHLNPYGIHVPILLTGPHIADDGADHSEFKVREAIWLAQKVGAQMHYTVWPTPVFTKLCVASDPMDALRDRVCGQNPAACSLSEGASIAQDCTHDSESGGYYCKGRPAILTTLKEGDFGALNPLCVPPN